MEQIWRTLFPFFRFFFRWMFYIYFSLFPYELKQKNFFLFCIKKSKTFSVRWVWFCEWWKELFSLKEKKSFDLNVSLVNFFLIFFSWCFFFLHSIHCYKPLSKPAKRRHTVNFCPHRSHLAVIHALEYGKLLNMLTNAVRVSSKTRKQTTSFKRKVMNLVRFIFSLTPFQECYCL